jgi:hypothetical protein
MRNLKYSVNSFIKSKKKKSKMRKSMKGGMYEQEEEKKEVERILYEIINKSNEMKKKVTQIKEIMGDKESAEKFLTESKIYSRDFEEIKRKIDDEQTQHIEKYTRPPQIASVDLNNFYKQSLVMLTSEEYMKNLDNHKKDIGEALKIINIAKKYNNTINNISEKYENLLTEVNEYKEKIDSDNSSYTIDDISKIKERIDDLDKNIDLIDDDIQKSLKNTIVESEKNLPILNTNTKQSLPTSSVLSRISNRTRTIRNSASRRIGQFRNSARTLRNSASRRMGQVRNGSRGLINSASRRMGQVRNTVRRNISKRLWSTEIDRSTEDEDQEEELKKNKKNINEVFERIEQKYNENGNEKINGIYNQATILKETKVLNDKEERDLKFFIEFIFKKYLVDKVSARFKESKINSIIEPFEEIIKEINEFNQFELVDFNKFYENFQKLQSQKKGDNLVVQQLQSQKEGDNLVVQQLQSQKEGDNLVVQQLQSQKEGDNLVEYMFECIKLIKKYNVIITKIIESFNSSNVVTLKNYAFSLNTILNSKNTQDNIKKIFDICKRIHKKSIQDLNTINGLESKLNDLLSNKKTPEGRISKLRSGFGLSMGAVSSAFGRFTQRTPKVTGANNPIIKSKNPYNANSSVSRPPIKGGRRRR